MRKRKQFLLLTVLCGLLLCFSGCKTKPKEFDISGYITAVLDSNYHAEDASYILFTGASPQVASENYSTTISNAAVRFCSLHQLNASEEQKTALAVIFGKAYAGCTYSVMDKVKTDMGYNVEVNFTPMDAYKNLSTQIHSMKTNAGESANNIGAAYIDNVVTLCENIAQSPSYGEPLSQVIDLRVSGNGEISLNLNLFDTIDEKILPF